MATPVGAMERGTTTGMKNATVNFCTVVTAAELAAAHVGGPCHNGTTVRSSILGVSTVTFSAVWGGNPGKGGAHYLSIIVAQATGTVPPAYLELLKGQVFGQGQPLKVAGHGGTTFPLGGDTVEVDGDTVSCVNPGTGDCTQDKLVALGHNYLMTILLYDVPRPLAGEPSSGEDDANDIAQERELYGPLAAIERTTTAKL